ncbi:hypothetical protein [Amycolatopsis sp. NPDC051372]|uniref:hypothetical protein n=1 Tax=Amycolatopsis sp. NPDC051372 TaxID=3155669 RepID=UPI0034431632
MQVPRLRENRLLEAEATRAVLGLVDEIVVGEQVDAGRNLGGEVDARTDLVERPRGFRGAGGGLADPPGAGEAADRVAAEAESGVGVVVAVGADHVDRARGERGRAGQYRDGQRGHADAGDQDRPARDGGHHARDVTDLAQECVGVRCLRRRVQALRLSRDERLQHLGHLVTSCRCLAFPAAP